MKLVQLFTLLSTVALITLTHNIPLDNISIRWAVSEHLYYHTHQNDDLSLIYGPINTWNTSLVTDMNALFWDYIGFEGFNSDISNWDVSSVTNI